MVPLPPQLPFLPSVAHFTPRSLPCCPNKPKGGRGAGGGVPPPFLLLGSLKLMLPLCTQIQPPLGPATEGDSGSRVGGKLVPSSCGAHWGLDPSRCAGRRNWEQAGRGNTLPHLFPHPPTVIAALGLIGVVGQRSGGWGER